MKNWVPSMRVTTAVSDLGPDSSTILTDLAEVLRMVSNSATATPGMAFATWGRTGARAIVPNAAIVAVAKKDLLLLDMFKAVFDDVIVACDGPLTANADTEDMHDAKRTSFVGFILFL